MYIIQLYMVYLGNRGKIHYLLSNNEKMFHLLYVNLVSNLSNWRIVDLNTTAGGYYNVLEIFTVVTFAVANVEYIK